MIILIMACNALKQPSERLGEDEFLITRKYAGVYLDYRHTGSEDFTGPNLIWIKTSMENVYGKISAYGKKCEFSAGDRLYLRRTYINSGLVSGYWNYYIENDSSVFYRLTEFQHNKKVLVQTWFN